MALFKIYRGQSENLPEIITSGFCYFTEDDGKFYIDSDDARTCINDFSAAIADILIEGSDIDITDNQDGTFTISTKYESKTAASGGTDVSLVTTGEKYTWNNKLDSSLKGTANGVAELDSTGKVPSSQLPSYVD